MSLSRAVHRSLACRPLRSFAPASCAVTSQSASIRIRPFSSTPTKLAHDQDPSEIEAQESPQSESATPAAAAVPSADSASVPWYLQVESPATQQEQHPFSDRQRLPELPSSPPPLLQPILEHVSVELGLDHLSLLDLRALDPPPALGANLIMIVGTARSEKHLHVSADRLCRWLRSNHQLTPFADGLLGRNELKLKMRRKAKRSRLLSAVGAKETGAGEVDDGIRTGWVCVNVGRVEGGSLESNIPQPEQIKGFVGFGRQTDGCRIVVQMLTDEKRGQIDLETLWNGILTRSTKARAEQDDEVDEAEQRLRQGKLIENLSPDQTQTYRPQSIPSPNTQQARAFHSSATSSNRQGAHSPTYSQNDILSDSNIDNSAALTLRHLLDHLKSMEHDLAQKALGKGSADQDSTSFLKAFYSAIPSFPEALHWHLHVALRCHAIRLRHPGYPSTCIIEDLKDIRLACLTPAEETYMAVLETLLTPPLESFPDSERHAVSTVSLRQALGVLDCMHEDGYDPISGPVLRLLYRATAPFASIQPSMTASTYDASNPKEPSTLNQLLPTLSLFALRRFAMASAWSEFWEMWRSYPRRFLSRSSDMYVMLFDVTAQRNSQRDAAATLRQCVPDMQREEPAIKIEGEIASAMRRCLEVAEPRLEQIAKEGDSSEWAILWRRCTRALT